MDGSYVQIESKHSYIGEDSKSSCQRSSASRSLFYWLRPLLGSGGKQFDDPKTVLPLHPLSRNGAKRSRGLKHFKFNYSRTNSITKKKRPTRRVQKNVQASRSRHGHSTRHYNTQSEKSSHQSRHIKLTRS